LKLSLNLEEEEGWPYYMTENLLVYLRSSTHRPIVRFQQNFVWGSRTVCRRGLHDKNCNCFKSKMADGRHFENR